VHGQVTHDLCGMQPSEIQAAGGVVAGFAITNGEIKLNSWTCNSTGPHSDGKKACSKEEGEVVRKVVEEWKRRGTVGFNMDVPI